MAQSNPFTIDTRQAVKAGQEIANQAERGIENQWYKAKKSLRETGLMGAQVSPRNQYKIDK